jgi:hypothetical protein
MGEPAVDAWLTDLAKREPETLTVEFDDEGVVSFRFLAYAALPRMRVDDSPAARARVAPHVPGTPIAPEDDPAAEAGRRNRAR